MKADVNALIEGLNKEFEKPVPRGGEEPSTALLIRRGFAGRVRLWVRAAEEYAGTRMVEYVEWVTLSHLRELALFMLLSLLLATLLLSSYPYPPQSLLRLILLVVLWGTAVASLRPYRDEPRRSIEPDHTVPSRGR